MASAIFRPLTPGWRMQARLPDGDNASAAVSDFIKPNDRLSSFERLEIYNRQYWFRLLDCIDASGEFDVVVVNDDVARAADELVGLLTAPSPGLVPGE